MYVKIIGVYYSSSVAAFQITCCRSFQATQFRGRIPASNARILTYVTPPLAPGTVS